MQQQHSDEITGTNINQEDNILAKNSKSPTADSLKKLSKTESYIPEQ